MIRSHFLSDLFDLRDTIDQFTNETLGTDSMRTLQSRNASNGTAWAAPIPVDVYSTNDHAVIIAAIPGMSPDDLDLTIHQNTVTLSGVVRNVADAEDAKDATWYVSELGGGHYRRSITLPFPINADAAQATFDQGMLRVKLPKAETAKSRKISIESRSPEAIASGRSAA